MQIEVDPEDFQRRVSRSRSLRDLVEYSVYDDWAVDKRCAVEATYHRRRRVVSKSRS